MVYGNEGVTVGKFEEFYHQTAAYSLLPRLCIFCILKGLSALNECWLNAFQRRIILLETGILQTSETRTPKIKYINPKFSLQSPSHKLLLCFQGRNLRGVKTTWKSIRHNTNN